MNEIKVSSKEASHILGVHESSVKRWCDGDVLAYDLTPGGHRRVSLDAVIGLGRDRKHESHLLRLGGDAASVWTALDLAKKNGSFDELCVLFRNWLGDNEVERPFHLSQFLFEEGVAPSTFLDEILAPVLRQVGKDWAEGVIRIAEEHRMTALVVSLLHRLAREFESRDESVPSTGSAVVACLPEVAHDLGALMTRIMLLHRGWKVFYLGPGLPLEDIADFQASVGAELVCLSVLPPRGMPEVRQAIHLLGRLYRSDETYSLAVGGAGVETNEVISGHPFERLGFFDSFQTFVSWLPESDRR
jgi:methanogenic corrinoid protein MtbC1